MPDASAWQEPVSPCTGICTLDARGLCVGCLRSGDEISMWPVMSASQRRQVLGRLRLRQRKRDHPCPPG